ncbi:MAG: hypothetical protein WCF20_07740 [Methylovirgula sp.]
MPNELDEFIDESIKRSLAKRYNPTSFIQMRQRWGTQEAVKRLVISGEIQSGFKKMQELGLLEWSVEAGVLKFPALFDRETQDAAKFRLDRVKHA